MHTIDLATYKDTSFQRIYKLAKEKNITALEKLLAEDACVNVKENYFPVITRLAMEDEHDAVALLLSQFDASIDYALYGYAIRGNEEKIKKLLKRGAHISLGLQGAAYANNEKLIRYFINRGANLTYALFGASFANHMKLIDYFIKQGCHSDSIVSPMVIGGHMDSIKKNNKEIVDVDFEIGYSKNYKLFLPYSAHPDDLCAGFIAANRFDLAYHLYKENKLSPFYIAKGAIRVGYKKIIKSLPLEQFSHEELNMLLSIAVTNAHEDLIPYLLSLGADKSLICAAALNGYGSILAKWIDPNDEHIRSFILDKASEGLHIRLINYYLNNAQQINIVLAAINRKGYLSRIVNNDNEQRRFISAIQSKDLREKIITHLAYHRYTVTPLLNKDTEILHKIINQHKLDFQEAQAWKLNKNIHCWFLQGIQLVTREKSPLPFDVFIRISSFVLGFESDLETRDFYKKHRNIMRKKFCKYSLQKAKEHYTESLKFKLFSNEKEHKMQADYLEQVNQIKQKYKR